MTEIAERYRRCAAHFTSLVAQVPADQWDSPTPCAEWTVRDLVRHIVDTQGMFLGLVGRSMGELPPFDEDPLAAWVAARDTIQADLDDPEKAGAEFDGYFGRTTFAQSVDRFLSFDLVVHGWDLARAAGLDEHIDADDVRAVMTAARAFGDAIRTPGVCGPAIEPPSGATEQQKMLAYLGRRP